MLNTRKNPPVVATFSTEKQVEIYLRAALYALDEALIIGIPVALLGHWVGTFVGALCYRHLPLADPLAFESMFTRTEVVTAGLKTGLTVGVAASLFSFFPAFKGAVDQGFKYGPSAIDPLKPFRDIRDTLGSFF